MMNPLKLLKNGILTENPTFVLVLGLCPTLAVTSSAINGIGMGLAATAVLMGSNLAISAIRRIIPDEIRIFKSSAVFGTFDKIDAQAKCCGRRNARNRVYVQKALYRGGREL